MAEPVVLQTLADLVSIPSVNSAYPDGVGEAAVVEYLRAFCAQRGIEHWQDEALPGRPNFFARVPGRDAAKRLVFEAHTDTVSARGMTIEPFKPEIREGALYGRGACDTKAGLAAMLCALADVAASGSAACEIWLAATIDEEHAFRGVAKLCEDFRADGAVVAEPTGLRAVVATKGVLRWPIRVLGRAAHSAKPHLGLNAISEMARLVLDLEDENERLAANPHPLLGPATHNIGLIQGGRQVNFVPDECTIQIDRRLIPGESIPDVLAGYQGRLDQLAQRFPSFHAEMGDTLLEDYPLETSADAGIVEATRRTLEQRGVDAEPIGVPYGSDASKLARIGIPSIVLGPGSIDQAHAAVEFVACDQVEKAREIYRGIMEVFQ